MANQTLTIQELERQIVDRSVKDPAFRAELLANPREVFSREVLKVFPDAPPLPARVNVKVVEQTNDTVYLVLPKPLETASRELRDDELSSVAGGIGDCLCTNPITASLFSSW